MVATSTIMDADRARPLRWWSAARLDAAVERLRAAMAPWARDWGLTLGDLGARNAVDGTAPSAPAALTLAHGAARLQAEGGAPVEQLHALLFGVPPPAVRVAPTLSDDTAAAAWAALLDALGAALPQQAAPPAAPPAATSAAPSAAPAVPPHATARWSGHLRLDVSVVGEGSAMRLALLIHPSAAAEWCTTATGPVQTQAPRQPLQRIDHVLADRSVRLAVLMDPVTLDLGTLQSLQIGDVLTLPHRLDQPLEVAAAPDACQAASSVCQAHLGQRDGRLAIALSRRPVTH
jgi:hypothetical protein